MQWSTVPKELKSEAACMMRSARCKVAHSDERICGKRMLCMTQAGSMRQQSVRSTTAPKPSAPNDASPIVSATLHDDMLGTAATSPQWLTNPSTHSKAVLQSAKHAHQPAPAAHSRASAVAKAPFFMVGTPRAVGWWSRRHITENFAEQHAHLHGGTAPVYDCLVIVEGQADARAVAKAMIPRAGIIWLGGAQVACNKEWSRWLRELLAGKPNSPLRPTDQVVVLLDADHAGKKGRTAIADVAPSVAHAFVPLWASRAQRVTKWHTRGTTGIEFAPPEAVQQAVHRALQRHWPASERPFTLESLDERGMRCDFNEPSKEVRQDVSSRREVVCGALGLGSCKASSLVSMLNRYNFTTEELDAAVRAADLAKAELSVEEYLALRACDIYKQ